MGRLIERIPFCELLAKSCFSFLEGASHPEEMIANALQYGYAGLALTDRNGVYGAPRAHVAAKEHQLPLIIGSEVSLDSGQRVVLLAQNRAGYGDLCELLTDIHTVHCEEAGRGGALPRAKLFEKSAHLFLLVPAFPIQETALEEIRGQFGERFSFVTSRFLDGLDQQRREAAERLSRRYNAPVVASNEPLFHERRRKALQDVMSCIRHGCKLWEGGHRLLSNDERYLKPPLEIARLFADRPEWVEHSVRIAETCRFSLDEITYHYPSEWIPPGETSDSFLAKLVWQGISRRPATEQEEALHRQIRHELTLIGELGYSDYFLTVWDIVRFAREQGILCQGRGSSANSVVCYALGITELNPVRMNLLFERFISRERKEPPDIDVDFEHERREEVIQYIYTRYGRERAAITAEVICYRRKSALREVAKVFDLPLETVETFQTLTHREKLAAQPLETFTTAAPELDAKRLSQYLSLAQELVGFPRHLGTHVGGFVLSHDALTRNIPIQKAAMENRTIVQWDKNDLDALGFVRVDILGLGILTCIRKCQALIERHTGERRTLNHYPEDPKVYAAACRADTIGVFQIESRAQMNMLPRLKPREFYDLVVEISLVRPGPIQGQMVHPYLRRRSGREKITYEHPKLEAILKKTYGVPLFQEQIMKMAIEVAGFTHDESDKLRRAMGAWRRTGNLMSALGDKFRDGLIASGIQREYAERIYQQIQGFAEYGFPESHAASFALLAYATLYLKFYYPAFYLIAILNSQPMGFYSKHTLIHDAERHGVKVEKLDVRYSDWDNTWEGPQRARLGFREVKGLHEDSARALVAARAAGPFASLDDLIARWKEQLHPKPLVKRELFLLAGADALRGFNLSRRQALWDIQALQLTDHADFLAHEEALKLPRESKWESVVLDYDSQGVCLTQHPMTLLRESANRLGIATSRQVAKMPAKKPVRVAGMVTSRQMPPTASGVLFVTLEDELGFTNLIVWHAVYEQYRLPLLQETFLCCEGRIEKAEDGDVTHVIVDRVLKLLDVPGLHTSSHDFH